MSDFLGNIGKIGERCASNGGNYINRSIAKAGYDKTYIGVVVGKETKEQYQLHIAQQIFNQDRDKPEPESKGELHNWLVSANGQTYRVDPNNCDITNVGQQVRLYIPNNMHENIYVETINANHRPDKITWVDNNDTFNGVDDRGQRCTWSTSSITERYDLSDNTRYERVYTITVKNRGEDNEECTGITCPDGFTIWLEDFRTNG